MQSQVSEVDLRSGIERLFDEFIEYSAGFTNKIFEVGSGRIDNEPASISKANLMIAKIIFSKWVIEILAVLHHRDSCGFEEMRRQIGTISPRMLSLKLTKLQKIGIIHREVLQGKPPRVNYSLTKKGEAVGKLGEPVMLFLRYHSGLLFSDGSK